MICSSHWAGLTLSHKLAIPQLNSWICRTRLDLSKISSLLSYESKSFWEMSQIASQWLTLLACDTPVPSASWASGLGPKSGLLCWINMLTLALAIQAGTIKVFILRKDRELWFGLAWRGGVLQGDNERAERTPNSLEPLLFNMLTPQIYSSIQPTMPTLKKIKAYLYKWAAKKATEMALLVLIMYGGIIPMDAFSLCHCAQLSKGIFFFQLKQVLPMRTSQSHCCLRWIFKALLQFTYL